MQAIFKDDDDVYWYLRRTETEGSVTHYPAHTDDATSYPGRPSFSHSNPITPLIDYSCSRGMEKQIILRDSRPPHGEQQGDSPVQIDEYQQVSDYRPRLSDENATSYETSMHPRVSPSRRGTYLIPLSRDDSCNDRVYRRDDFNSAGERDYNLLYQDEPEGYPDGRPQWLPRSSFAEPYDHRRGITQADGSGHVPRVRSTTRQPYSHHLNPSMSHNRNSPIILHDSNSAIAPGTFEPIRSLRRDGDGEFGTYRAIYHATGPYGQEQRRRDMHVQSTDSSADNVFLGTHAGHTKNRSRSRPAIRAVTQTVPARAYDSSFSRDGTSTLEPKRCHVPQVRQALTATRLLFSTPINADKGLV